MTETLLIFLAIPALFALLMIVKWLSKWKFCVICLSISIVWLVLLAMHYLGYFENKVLLAVLMGGSAVGLFYVLEKKVKEKTQIFRLPFLLSEVWVIYALLGLWQGMLSSALVLAALWGVFILLYSCQYNERIKSLAKQIIACCRDW